MAKRIQSFLIVSYVVFFISSFCLKEVKSEEIFNLGEIVVSVTK